MDKIDKVFVINLDRRKDRWEETQKELQRVGIPIEKVQRISAVPHPNGAVGCSLSHVTVMCNAIKDKLNNIMVLEDDVSFIESLEKVEEAINKAVARPDFKAILLAYTWPRPQHDASRYGTYDHARVNIDHKIAHLLNGKTTACYVMNQCYFTRYSRTGFMS